MTRLARAQRACLCQCPPARRSRAGRPERGGAPARRRSPAAAPETRRPLRTTRRRVRGGVADAVGSGGWNPEFPVPFGCGARRHRHSAAQLLCTAVHRQCDSPSRSTFVPRSRVLVCTYFGFLSYKTTLWQLRRTHRHTAHAPAERIDFAEAEADSTLHADATLTRHALARRSRDMTAQRTDSHKTLVTSLSVPLRCLLLCACALGRARLPAPPA